MARPIKKGLDYFPMDINWKSGAMEYLYCMHGMLGVAVIKLSLEPRIYGGEGYFVAYNERSPLIFSNEFGDQLSVADGGNRKRHEIYDEIVQSAIEYGVFDKAMYQKYGILTSADIQEKYVRAKEKSKRVEMDDRYLLLSDVKIPENVEIIGVCGEETGVISPDNSIKKRKEKESIEKYRKEKNKESASKPSGYDKILSEIENEELRGLYTEYIKMRKLIHAPMTDRALRMLIEKVHTLEPSSGERQKRLLENAIMNNWKSVYPLKEDIGQRRAQEKPKRSRANNYEDTNELDFDALERQILDQMLEADAPGACAKPSLPEETEKES